MGLFSTLAGSYKKSKKLRKLQLKISPPDQSVNDIASNFVTSLKSGGDEENEALEKFLDLCINDEGVANVLSQYDMDRNDLKDIYWHLARNGFGQWINGHHVALSTIAYYEPLLFVVESRRREVPVRELATALFAYWEGKVTQGELLRSLQYPRQQASSSNGNQPVS